MFEVRIRAERVSLGLRKIRHDRGKPAIERIQMMNATGLRLRDLLLEKRVQNNRGATRVLQPTGGVEMIGQRGPTRYAAPSWTARSQPMRIW